MLLVELNDGDRAKIKKIPCGAASEKMSACELREGCEFEKISGSPLGRFVTIAVGERYFAITNDIAEIIEVTKQH